MPRRATLLIAVPVLLAACQPVPRAPEAGPPGGPASADPGALAVADSVVAALGGWEGWAEARYLEFRFVAERDGAVLRDTEHRWDRATGAYRMRGVSREGVRYDVVMDLGTREGEVTLDGGAPDDSTRAQWLERAYGTCINDAYWLLMPFKLHDPGVHLADEGARTDSLGKTWRVIGLSFDPGTGLTPDDRYWVYVDPATSRPGRWDYHLEGMAPDDPPRVATWDGWRGFGSIWLATVRESAGATLRFEGIRVLEAVPEGAFEEGDAEQAGLGGAAPPRPGGGV